MIHVSHLGGILHDWSLEDFGSMPPPQDPASGYKGKSYSREEGKSCLQSLPRLVSGTPPHHTTSNLPSQPGNFMLLGEEQDAPLKAIGKSSTGEGDGVNILTE